MTIAIGILGSDNGVTLGADSEQTWGYLKSSAEKIWTHEDEKGALAIAGAGDGGNLECLSQWLVDAFITLPAGSDHGRIEKTLSLTLREFHKQHIIPYTKDLTQDDPRVWLIVGFQGSGAARLWASQRGALRRCDRYTSTGIGREYAEAMLGEVFKKKNATAKIDTRFAEKLAAYVAFQTKLRVQGCGMATALVSLRDGHVQEIQPEKVSVFSYHCNRYSMLQPLMLQYALGYDFEDDQIKAVQLLIGWLTSARNQLRQSERATVEGWHYNIE
ncbi:MAG TPA: hypothetical protein VMU80_09115 [Bryobacteraceae bacterium]|nr:hypothetical protein [Bryobacteraceae bacterium]